MCDMYKLKDVIPDFTNSFFSHMSNLHFENMIQLSDLDINFMTKYGNHYIGNLIELYLSKNENEQLTDSQITSISNYIYNKYKIQWTHLYDVLSLEYNALDNTYRKETSTETDNLTVDRTKTNTGTTTIAERNSDTSTNTQTNNTLQETNGQSSSNGENTDSIWGFNSSSNVNSTKNDSNVSSTGNTKTADTGTIRLEGTQSNNKDNSTTYNLADKDTGSENRVISRTNELSGSIGIITPQQMMQQEIDFWKYNFYDRIMVDLKNELLISIY